MNVKPQKNRSHMDLCEGGIVRVCRLSMGLWRLVGMSDCWMLSYLQIQDVILEISKRYTKTEDMKPLLTLGVWTSQPVKYERESGLSLESFALQRKPLEQRFVNSKEVVIHQTLIHHPSSIHPTCTHLIYWTCLPSRQTALMVVSGHQTLSNLKRIRVQ